MTTSPLPISSPQRELTATSLSCPVCSMPGQIIAPHLPSPARSSSKIKCRGSGEVMNHSNPPMVLPNGQVYSKNFLRSHKRPHELNDDMNSSPTSNANKGIDLLLTFRENEKRRAMERDLRQFQSGRISRTCVVKKEENTSEEPTSSNLFCCPLTNQTFNPEQDSKPIYII